MKLIPLLILRVGAAALLLPFAGCVTPQPSSELCGIHDSDGPAIPETFTGTLQRTRKTRAAHHVVMATSMETASCGNFDRVVFDFDGLRLPPQYTVEYVTEPITECGSGNTVPLAGHAKLRITFDQTQAHTFEGQSFITNRNRTLNHPNLKQIVMVCDFEGLVEVVLGLDTKKPYRVVELLNDSKLVIDVQH